MNHKKPLLKLFFAGLIWSQLGWAGNLHHEIKISLQPQRNEIQVTDKVTWPASDPLPNSMFLNKRLEILKASSELKIITESQKSAFQGINSGDDQPNNPEQVQGYSFVLPPDSHELTISYKGNMHFELNSQKEEYARGFRDTMASLSSEGVYLSGASFWYPHFENELMTFSLEIQMPASWHVISQGSGKSALDRAQWTTSTPMDEIYLVGGPLTFYSKTTGTVEAQVYLREKDPALAKKYLETTAQYIEMYRSLIGPYPFDKFALVENFWETGYGMASFTLLGPKVIRMPFILHSSFPHEILHNWWGNSVLVDYESGNWCEGLTAYEADHLIQQQRGMGSAYRKTTLQKYKNYVSGGQDFPISEFRSRHSAATEAIGYGKTLMVFHMLRSMIGDPVFNKALASFYRTNKGRKASFQDLEKSFAQVSGMDLSGFFEQWIHRTGAPRIILKEAGVKQAGGEFRLSGTLTQAQEGQAYALQIPVLVQFPRESEMKWVSMTQRDESFEWGFNKEPIKLTVDPAFDIFRLLDPREIPSSIGNLFGSSRLTAVLPASETKERLDLYRSLLQGWSHEEHLIDIKMDDHLEKLPENENLWIIGRTNRFAPSFMAYAGECGFKIQEGNWNWQNNSFKADNHSLVLTVSTGDHEHVWGFLDVSPDEAFTGMGRKLPHYGKYSFLAFEGEEPVNVHKGQWDTRNSPMEKTFTSAPFTESALAPEQALAQLPAVYSEESLKNHVEYLASEKLHGRGIGTQGIADAREYIKNQFQVAGLVPGNSGSYQQDFELEGQGAARIIESNLIGMIPGEKSSESVLITAHYDHLGMGWPDVHQGDEGKIHYGADDNASGVALLLEFANTFAKNEEKPKKNIVFIAFSAEEAGRKGSEFFVANPTVPLNGIRGVINLDTIGRLGDRSLGILGTGNTQEWVHIFMGCGFVTGLKNQCIPGLTESSDQWSFVQAGIPAVQIFSGTHTDYHRPGDTADKIDYAGIVKIATFVQEAVMYLLDRDEPLTFIKSDVSKEKTVPISPSVSPTTGRKVSFGSIPDMAFQGPGVKLSGTIPDSPAANAQLKEGDILVRVNGLGISDLRSFSEVLKGLEPGQTVDVIYIREGEELKTSVTLAAR